MGGSVPRRRCRGARRQASGTARSVEIYDTRSTAAAMGTGCAEAVLMEGTRVVSKGQGEEEDCGLRGSKVGRAPNGSRGICYVSGLWAWRFRSRTAGPQRAQGTRRARADDQVVMCVRQGAQARRAAGGGRALGGEGRSDEEGRGVPWDVVDTGRRTRGACRGAARASVRVRRASLRRALAMRCWTSESCVESSEQFAICGLHCGERAAKSHWRATERAKRANKRLPGIVPSWAARCQVPHPSGLNDRLQAPLVLGSGFSLSRLSACCSLDTLASPRQNTTACGPTLAPRALPCLLPLPPG